MIDGKRINYYQFIKSTKNQDCIDAVKRIAPRIDLDKINTLINGVEQLSDLQKDFLKRILKLRKEIILDSVI